MTDFFDGDPRLTLDEDGADLIFKGGQPVMDQGLENAVLISLFTDGAWVGNTLFSQASQKLGGRFEKSVREPLTVSAINDIRNAVLADLQGLIDDGVVSQIAVEVANPTSNRIEVAIGLQPPNEQPQYLLLAKNGVNWIQQALDPAYRRV